MTIERLCRITVANYMRFFEDRRAAPSTPNVPGVSLPIFKRGSAAFSWSHFPEERNADAIELEVAEGNAYGADDEELLEGVVARLDDEDEEGEPAPRRARLSGVADGSATDEAALL